MIGSICLTEILAQCKKGHTAFTKADNGKIYFNFSQFVNDEPDKFGNDSSLLLNSKKESRDKEGKCYIGNAKWSDKAGGQPLSPKDTATIPDDDDLPF